MPGDPALLARRALAFVADLAVLAAGEPFCAPVARLMALRGISTLSALTLVVEIGDFARFARAADFMSFVGLVPSEHSSGASRRHRCRQAVR